MTKPGRTRQAGLATSLAPGSRESATGAPRREEKANA